MKLGSMYFFSFCTIAVCLSQTVCEIDGTRGLKFGMSFEESQTVELDRVYPTLEDIMVLTPSMTKEELCIKLGDNTIKELLSRHRTKFSYYNAIGGLLFINDKLSNIIYTFEVETTNRNNYVDIYFDLKKQLTQKYGSPSLINEKLEYPYEDDFPNGANSGTAIAIGKGTYFTHWACLDNKKTISLMLDGDNYIINLRLFYSDKAYDLSEEDKQKEILDDF